MPAGGRADPRSAGGTDGASAWGHRSVAAGPVPSAAAAATPRPRLPARPPRRFPLLPRPPPPAAAPRAPPAKLSLFFSPLSPPQRPPCLRRRWEGLGLPEVSGMGRGGGVWGAPRWLQPAQASEEGALTLPLGLGEGTPTWWVVGY